MRYFISIIFVSLLLSGCNSELKNQLSKDSSITQTTQNESAPQAFQISADNKWANKSSWGEQILLIAADLPLLRDADVLNEYIQTAPLLCEQFVLLRARHDGSCWVDAGMFNLIYQMINAKEDNFDRIRALFQEIFTWNNIYFPQKEPAIEDDFLKIFELIRAKMDFRFTFDLISHQNVRDVLVKGFRKILVNYYMNKGGPSCVKLAEIAKPNSFGDPNDFAHFLNKVGLMPSAQLRHNLDFKKPKDPTRVYYLTYIDSTLEEIERGMKEDLEDPDFPGNHEEATKLSNQSNIDKLPDIMPIGSKKAYTDIIVRKSFAEQYLKSQNQLIYK